MLHEHSQASANASHIFSLQLVSFVSLQSSRASVSVATERVSRRPRTYHHKHMTCARCNNSTPCRLLCSLSGEIFLRLFLLHGSVIRKCKLSPSSCVCERSRKGHGVYNRPALLTHSRHVCIRELGAHARSCGHMCASKLARARFSESPPCVDTLAPRNRAAGSLSSSRTLISIVVTLSSRVKSAVHPVEICVSAVSYGSPQVIRDFYKSKRSQEVRFTDDNAKISFGEEYEFSSATTRASRAARGLRTNLAHCSSTCSTATWDLPCTYRRQQPLQWTKFPDRISRCALVALPAYISAAQQQVQQLYCITACTCKSTRAPSTLSGVCRAFETS